MQAAACRYSNPDMIQIRVQTVVKSTKYKKYQMQKVPNTNHFVICLWIGIIDFIDYLDLDQDLSQVHFSLRFEFTKSLTSGWAHLSIHISILDIIHYYADNRTVISTHVTPTWQPCDVFTWPWAWKNKILDEFWRKFEEIVKNKVRTNKQLK